MTTVKLPSPKGFIHTSVRKPDGRVIETKEKNVITNRAFLLMFGQNSPGFADTIFTHMALGRGSVPITRETETLSDQIVRVGSLQANISTATIEDVDYTTTTFSYTWQIGEIEGDITEVALSNGAGSTAITAGKLLDEPITVDIEDQLTVNYTVAFPKLSLPYTLQEGNVVVDGSPVPYTLRLTNDFIDASPSSTSSVGYRTPRLTTGSNLRPKVNNNSLAANTFTYEVTVTDDTENNRFVWDIGLVIRPSAGNLSIGKIATGNSRLSTYNSTTDVFPIEIEFDTPVNKPDTKKLEMNLSFSIEWI